MSEIKYDFEKLESGAKTIADEQKNIQDFDRALLIEIEECLESFRSDYAQSALSAIAHMKDIKADALISDIGKYAGHLDTARELMKGTDEGIADSYSKVAAK